jgi:hypothetical protein
MSGPIVRSGPTQKYSSNWDQVFGGKKSVGGTKAGGSGAAAKKATPKKKAKPAKKKA